MNTTKRSGIGQVFSFMWKLINGIRLVISNILFLFVFLFLFLVFVGSLSDNIQPIPEKGGLRIQLKGGLVDQLSYADPLSQLAAGGQGEHSDTVVRHLVAAIDAARDDQRITKIFLDLNDFTGGGLSKLDEVGQALARFKNSGKQIIAASDNYSQAQYFLASFADHIYLHSMGVVELTGFAAYGNYFKDALDKLEVNVHVFRVGDYKDAVEPFIRNDMSEASREHNGQWVNEMWGIYTSIIEGQRQLPKGAIDNMVNNYDAFLREVNGNTAQLALNHRLVDELASREEIRNKLKQEFGTHPLTKDLQVVDVENYFRHLQLRAESNKNKVALIVAAGNIYDGERAPGEIGGDTLSRLIRDAREDDNIKAVVLRIDSGGGSAFASELIREELLATQAKGKPVVVSMGSVAASGGYWIAADADEVWATPTTITGSIGVFSVFPTVEKTLAKVGVSTDGVSSTKLAGWSEIDRPLSPLAANVIQQNVEFIYRRFISIVANGRDTVPDLIYPIAGGRVWSASRAHDYGLVDQLGYLNDAIASAAKLANLDQYELKVIEKQLSPFEQFIFEISKNVSSVFHWQENDSMIATAMQLQQWQKNNPFLSTLNLLRSSTEANPVLAHCIACAPPLL